MQISWRKEVEELALGAGAILKKYYSKVHRITKKPGAGIVTEADLASENYLLKKIFRKFPESSIITEESGEHRGAKSLVWIMDPLDGTTNYAHAFPWFCVSIGVQVDGEMAAGAILNPISQELFLAEKGKGAWLNGKRIRVSKIKRLDEALLGTGFYYSSGKQLRAELSVFSSLADKTLGIRRPGAAALDLAYVACGRYDGFWERRLAPWDVAAGILLVTEAGGKVSDYRGQPTDIYRRELVATNGLLHPVITKATGRKKF